jgi:hypothetical protein
MDHHEFQFHGGGYPMSDLARYLAGDNYLTRSASGIKRGMSALADSLTARSNEGIENMGAALSGVRVRPGAILTDAGYVMPDASGQPDFTQVGLEREPDTMRLLELFGSAMTPVKGASLAAKSGAGGKVAADVARALPMDEASRMARAAEMGFDPSRVVYHGTDSDFREFDLGRSSNPKENAVFFTNKASEADRFGEPREFLTKGDMLDVRWKDFSEDPIYDPEVMAAILEQARSGGRQGAIIRGVQNFEGGPLSTTTAVFDPANIRSRFAAFDPARADEADLLASRANLGPIVNALLQGYDRR